MIVRNGYLARFSGGERNGKRRATRDWWLVKYNGNKKLGYINVNCPAITIPEEYVGKKIRFRIEVVPETEITPILTIIQEEPASPAFSKLLSPESIRKAREYIILEHQRRLYS